MNIDKATELGFTIATQRDMLKKCRNIMRDKNIGNLYPVQPEDFRKALKNFTAKRASAMSNEKLENEIIKITFEKFNPDVDVLLEFIEEQGLLPDQLERFLRKKNG